MDYVWTIMSLWTHWDLFESIYGYTYALDLDDGLQTMDIGLKYTSNHFNKS